MSYQGPRKGNVMSNIAKNNIIVFGKMVRACRGYPTCHVLYWYLHIFKGHLGEIYRVHFLKFKNLEGDYEISKNERGYFILNFTKLNK